MNSFGELKNCLRIVRFQNGEMTQQELAERVGVSRQTIIAIEQGKFNPSTKLSLQIAQVFHVRVEDIFFLEGDES
ncbi:MAG: helix-turn-helix transcriptional regulator [Anaerolineaceae bacterium]|nr:helix-turn-helix transcriptional regulator [Anaerolineaceae bacterium]